MVSLTTSADFSELHIAQDKAAEFYAVICLHQNGRGPALGGCRFIEYQSTNDAIQDAIRLSYAMSYKAAISELPHDGGKAVIVKPKQLKNRDLLLNRFAEFVDSLNGKYITTVDSGTNATDMAVIKNKTSHVIGYLDNEENNPSNSTALGVFRGIQAAVKLKHGSESLNGLHVAIQGIGSVGYRLARLLKDQGVRLTICDARKEIAAHCAEEFDALWVNPDSIFDVKCDVFSPCALGRIINEQTIQKLQTNIIAGAANDQLSSENLADELHKKDILFIPDYMINAGGLIHLSLEMQNKNKNDIDVAVNRIGSRILKLAEQAKDQNKTLYHAAKYSAEVIMKS